MQPTFNPQCLVFVVELRTMKALAGPLIILLETRAHLVSARTQGPAGSTSHVAYELPGRMPRPSRALYSGA